jgi:hypothetical protein
MERTIEKLDEDTRQFVLNLLPVEEWIYQDEDPKEQERKKARNILLAEIKERIANA